MSNLKTSPPESHSPFLSLLSDAEAVQIREVSPSTRPAIVRSVEEAIRIFDEAQSDSETRSFLVTVKKPNIKPSQLDDSKKKSNQEHTTIIRQANLLMKNGDFLLARNLFSFVLRGDIRHAEALQGLGICLLNLGQIAAAKKCFLATTGLYNSPEGFVHLGLSYIQEKNDQAAYDAFKKVNSPDSLPSSVRFNYFKELGNCLTRIGRINEAFLSYKSALTLEPNSDTIYVNLGTLEMQRNGYAAAATNFQKALDLAPENSKAYCGLGLLAQIKHEKTMARTFFEKTLDLDSQNQIALLQLLALGEHSNHREQLKLRLVKFLIKEPINIEMRFLMANLLFSEQNWVEAQKELDFILIKNPEHKKARKLKNDISNQKHGPGVV